MASKRDKDLQNPYLLREVQINRYRDSLIFIPFFAACFFLSPAIDLVSGEAKFIGLSAKYLAFFMLWLFAILALRRINRRLQKKLSERAQ